MALTVILDTTDETGSLLDELRAKGVAVRERVASREELRELLAPGGELTVIRPQAGRTHLGRTAFLEAIVENIPAMIFVKDAEKLAFQFINRAGEELIGIKRELMLDKTDADFFPPAEAAFFVAKDRKVLQERQALDIPEEPIETSSGPRWLHTRKVPVLGPEGEPRYLLGISMDITRRKEIEGELRLARDAAEAASRAKSEFLANMSHELRTPLNAILGFSELIEDGLRKEADAELRPFVRQIQGSGKHLLTLINNLLDLAKVESGHMALNLKSFDVVAELTAAARAVDVLAFEKKISLTAEVPEAPLPPVMADESKFHQVLYNLLSNALKFTPPGGHVRVSAAVIREDGADAMEVSVSDTGIGISPEDQDRLFRPFEQVDSSYARRHAGTGLGLALTRRLVELHGGRIRVESRPGKGSTFSFTIPVSGT
jgi:PAS domain S-box-containing protein